MKETGEKEIKKGYETGRLKVIEKAGRDKNGRTLWRCACSCGNECFCTESRLTGDYVQSCGCLQKEKAAETIRKAREKLIYKNGSCLTAYNAPDEKNNSSGIKGVYYYKKTDKWCAQIRYAGKNHNLGLYINKEDAAAVRKAAENFIKENYEDPDKINRFFLKKLYKIKPQEEKENGKENTKRTGRDSGKKQIP